MCAEAEAFTLRRVDSLRRLARLRRSATPPPCREAALSSSPSCLCLVCFLPADLARSSMGSAIVRCCASHCCEYDGSLHVDVRASPPAADLLFSTTITWLRLRSVLRSESVVWLFMQMHSSSFVFRRATLTSLHCNVHTFAPLQLLS